MKSYDRERQVATEAVLLASQLCREVQAHLVTADAMDKKDRSPVTVADFGAQAVVNLALMAAFPDDQVVGEEDAAQLRSDEGTELREKVVQHVQRLQPGAETAQILSAIDHGRSEGGPHGRHWVLDPIDGTKGFLRGDQYAIALALMEEGRVVLGLLGCPNLPTGTGDERGCLFAATTGHGAVMRALQGEEEHPIRVSEASTPAEASFCESVESGHSAHGDAARIAERLGITRPPYRIDSQCKYAAIARGDASIYLRLPTRQDYEEKIWDHAAGCIVVEEAGGQVTDISGQPLDFSLGRTLRDNKGVVATNGRFHDEVIAAVSGVLG